MFQVVYEEESMVMKDMSALDTPLDGPNPSSLILERVLKHASFMGPAGYKVWKALHLILDSRPATRDYPR